jgi:hypothetical protein
LDLNKYRLKKEQMQINIINTELVTPELGCARIGIRRSLKPFIRDTVEMTLTIAAQTSRLKIGKSKLVKEIELCIDRGYSGRQKSDIAAELPTKVALTT